MALLLLAGEILLSVLAVFGLYVLCRSLWLLWLGDTRIVLAVRQGKDTAKEDLFPLIERARGHAWLCGGCAVVLLPADKTEEK